MLRALNKDRKKRGKSRIHTPPTDIPKRPLTSYLRYESVVYLSAISTYHSLPNPIRFAQELKTTNQLSLKDAPQGMRMSPVVWVARESGARWNVLPASEKEKYAKAYTADFAKWRASTANSSV